MGQSLKIAIIGDFNFSYNSHHATNLAIDHSAHFLELEINYYWLKLNEIVKFKRQQYLEYDGFIIAPGPILNAFFLHGIIKELIKIQTPVFINGEGFSILLDVLINTYRLSSQQEKLVSDNLVEGQHFEKIYLTPHSESLKKIYQNYSTVELTSSRFSIYPQLIASLTEDVADIEAYNQFEDPEIISLKNHPFFVATGFSPQISSTRELPHPLFYTFFKACQIALEKAG